MTTRLFERKSTRRGAIFATLASLSLLAAFTFGADAQDAQKAKDKDDKAAAGHRDSLVETGYTRPGNVDDKYVKDGEILPAAFKGADVKKFKIMGGTVYFAVFKNTGFVEGDTYATGMPNIDSKFRTGRSFKDSYSPRYDTKARYLYLYQVVNDRGLDVKMKADDKQIIGLPKFDPKAKAPQTEEIASFALKLLVDPRYITSWGHFSGAGFAANVVDVDINGKVVKNVADDGKNKAGADKDIRLAFSYLPAIVSKIVDPAYSAHARAFPLNDLDQGFGVDRSTLNLDKSKAYGDLKQVVGQAGNDIGWTNFAKNLLLDAEQSAMEPNYVQLMFMSDEEKAEVAAAAEIGDDNLTRAIFRADWDRIKAIKQGDRSVVFGFTTDLPPTAAPVRIDTPKAAALSETIRLESYFSDEGTGRAGEGGLKFSSVEPAADGNSFVLFRGPENLADELQGGEFVQVGGGTALALAMGTALGQAVTPVPAPAAAPSGFSGITGAVGGLGGSQPGGGFSGGIPAMNGAYSRQGGGFGGGGGFSGGGGVGGGGGFNGNGTATPTQAQGQGQAQIPVQVINFTSTLTNQQQQQQKQQQQQQQKQKQGQLQFQNQHGGHNHECHHGHVVPAPASLLLGLLGLPGLYFFRRRKIEA